MAKKISPTKGSLSAIRSNTVNTPSAQVQNEFSGQEALFELQTPVIQRFLEAQARLAADAMLHNQSQARFKLPDQIYLGSSEDHRSVQIPSEYRDQLVGGVFDRLTRSDVRAMLRQRLLELEGSSNEAVSVAACLLRHAIAVHMIHDLLPSGRSVQYKTADGEEIPTIPVEEQGEMQSAITATTDAIVEESTEGEDQRGELLVPYVPAARRFYLPQWVAFDDQCHLLVGSVNEAEAHIASMQHYLSILHMAVSVAPYMVASQEYQKKRYGMLGQLINQGRALARYITGDMIRVIKKRATAHDLNRGLSLSLPYFDDQALEMRIHNFDVIPAGRIMFAPVFVVRAAQEEQAKVAQDTRLSPSTRRYLLAELQEFERAFSKQGKTQ